MQIASSGGIRSWGVVRKSWLLRNILSAPSDRKLSRMPVLLLFTLPSYGIDSVDQVKNGSAQMNVVLLATTR